MCTASIASKTDSFAPLSALLVAALCLPAALLVGSGATAELLDAATLTRLTENRDRPVLFCLTVLHIVSGAMLAFAFATASHEARRIRDGTSDAVVSPTAQVRNRKSSVMRILTRDNRLAPAEVRDLQSGPVIGAFTSRRAAVPSMESPIVNEMVCSLPATISAHDSPPPTAMTPIAPLRPGTRKLPERWQRAKISCCIATICAWPWWG